MSKCHAFFIILKFVCCKVNTTETLSAEKNIVNIGLVLPGRLRSTEYVLRHLISSHRSRRRHEHHISSGVVLRAATMEWWVNMVKVAGKMVMMVVFIIIMRIRCVSVLSKDQA